MISATVIGVLAVLAVTVVAIRWHERRKDVLSAIACPDKNGSIVRYLLRALFKFGDKRYDDRPLLILWEQLGIDRPAITNQQDVNAPIAVAHARLADVLDPVFKGGLIASLRLVDVK
ncbi:MAG: hypothetical protein J0H40_24155 [Rhizobiales bacterium]|nr:hypothetical protein [Hyphomicrobiales bacterium]